MPLTTKTRFAKRKLEITELRKDKHTINCWFMHENIEKIQGEKIENNEMIQRTRTKLFCY